MQAVILCGGRGQRLMPLTEQIPAPLLRVCCKEILAYNIEYLKKAGFDRITLIAGYRGEMIENHIKSIKNKWEDILLEITDSNNYGVVYTIKKILSENNEQEILVTDGNGIYEADISEFMCFHKKAKRECTVLSAENKVGGLYILSRQFVEKLSDVKDLQRQILQKIQNESDYVTVYKSEKFCHKVVNPEDFLEIQKHFLENQKSEIVSYTNENFPGVTFVPPVCIGKNVVIESGCTIKNSVIDDGAVISAKTDISSSFVGENSFISNRCEIDGAVICKNSTLGKNVICKKNSLVGEGCTVGRDTEICRNSHIWSFVNIFGKSTVNKPMVKSGKYVSRYIDEEGEFTISSEYINPSECVYAGQALASALDLNDLVMTGRSQQQGSEIISECVRQGLLNSGAKVIDLGECTPGQLVFALTREKGKICIYADYLSRGKITILSPGGINVNRRFETKFEENLKRRQFRRIMSKNVSKAYNGDCEKFFYENYVENLLAKKFNGINVEIRTDNFITAEISDRIFHKRNDIHGEKIIFSISSGGKKCSAYTDKTGGVPWEKLVCLCCDYLFEKNLPVALPYVFSTAVDYVAEEKNGILYRYYNSPLDDYDITARKTASEIHNLFTADGFILSALVCRILTERKVNLRQALEKIPDIFTTQRFVSTNIDSNRLCRTFGCDLSRPWEGFAVNRNQSRIIVRPQKAGGGLNVFVQAKNCEIASNLCDDVINRIKFLENAEEILNSENKDSFN